MKRFASPSWNCVAGNRNLYWVAACWGRGRLFHSLRRIVNFSLRLLILTLALAASQVFAEPASSGVGPFVLRFDYGGGNWKKCPRSGPVQCVLGAVQSKEPLLLLGSQSSTTCFASTNHNFESDWDSGSFPLTSIDLKDCMGFRFELAFKSRANIPYRLLKHESLRSPPIERQREIETAIRRAIPKIEPSGSEHPLGLAPAKPRIFRLPSMDRDSYIAVFENSEIPGDQVHFQYDRGAVKLIHSAAAISSVFSLGNKYFIHYKFTCRLGCGYWGDLVVQFPKSGFLVEMFDASTST